MRAFLRSIGVAAALSAAVPGASLAASDAEDLVAALANASLPQEDTQPPAEATDGGRRAAGGSAGYRTVCVRLCDGYYWPVSAATSMERFQHDRSVCESSCQQPARLYYQPAGESDARRFVGLDGKPYTALPKAFSYRSSINPQCRCRPDPWSQSEVERHQGYGQASAVVPLDEAQPNPQRPAPPTTPVTETSDDTVSSDAEQLSRAFGALLEPAPDVSGRRQKPVDGAGKLQVPLR